VEGRTLYGDCERYVKEGPGGGHLSPWGPRWGNLEVVFFTGDFERQVKKALETNGGLLCWGLIKICKRRLWKWNIFLYVGAS
jgi:hypothetical protein